MFSLLQQWYIIEIIVLWMQAFGHYEDDTYVKMRDYNYICVSTFFFILTISMVCIGSSMNKLMKGKTLLFFFHYHFFFHVFFHFFYHNNKKQLMNTLWFFCFFLICILSSFKKMALYLFHFVHFLAGIDRVIGRKMSLIIIHYLYW